MGGTSRLAKSLPTPFLFFFFVNECMRCHIYESWAGMLFIDKENAMIIFFKSPILSTLLYTVVFFALILMSRNNYNKSLFGHQML